MSENWLGSKNVRKLTLVQNVRKWTQKCQKFPMMPIFQNIWEKFRILKISKTHQNRHFSLKFFWHFFTRAKSFSDIFTRNHTFISDGSLSFRVKVKSKIIIKAVFKSIFLFIVVLPRGTPPNPTWFLNISSRIICKRIISIESLSKMSSESVV